MNRLYESLHGGLKHIVVSLTMLIGLAVYAKYPGEVAAFFMGEQTAGPRLLTMHGARENDCAARSVETIIGTMGCAGTRRAAHLDKITLTRGN